MQPRADKVRRPGKFRGPTNYAIEGHEGRFRYVQHGGFLNPPGMAWTSTDKPRQGPNDKLLVVASVGASYGGFGLFEALDEEQTY